MSKSLLEGSTRLTGDGAGLRGELGDDIDINARRAASTRMAATLSAALDRLGINGQCAQIQSRSEQISHGRAAPHSSCTASSKPEGDGWGTISMMWLPVRFSFSIRRGRKMSRCGGRYPHQIAPPTRPGAGTSLIDGICRDVALCVSSGIRFYAVIGCGKRG